MADEVSRDWVPETVGARDVAEIDEAIAEVGLPVIVEVVGDAAHEGVGDTQEGALPELIPVLHIGRAITRVGIGDARVGHAVPHIPVDLGPLVKNVYANAGSDIGREAGPVTKIQIEVGEDIHRFGAIAHERQARGIDAEYVCRIERVLHQADSTRQNHVLRTSPVIEALVIDRHVGSEPIVELIAAAETRGPIVGEPVSEYHAIEIARRKRRRAHLPAQIPVGAPLDRPLHRRGVRRIVQIGGARRGREKRAQHR